MKKQILTDIWEKIERVGHDDCWNYKGTLTTGGGYGYFISEQKSYVAHRVVYYLTHPNTIQLKAPKDKSLKQFVLHKCDNRKCCNPNHLFLGNYEDNNRDASKKGRSRSGAPKGAKHKLAKLNMDQVKEIRRLSKEEKLGNEHLRKLYNVSNEAIRRVVLNLSYKE